jgi:hypothetical protein
MQYFPARVRIAKRFTNSSKRSARDAMLAPAQLGDSSSLATRVSQGMLGVSIESVVTKGKQLLI